MQVTPLRIKDLFRIYGRPQRIFSVTEEEVIVAAHGQLVSVNRTTGINAARLKTVWDKNYFYFCDGVVFINPFNPYGDTFRDPVVYNLNNDELRSINTRNLFQVSHSWFQLVPGLNTQCHLLWQDRFGTWCGRDFTDKDFEKLKKGENLLDWSDVTRKFTPEELFVDTVNKKYYGVTSGNDKNVFHIEDLATGRTIGDSAGYLRYGRFIVFNDKVLFAKPHGLYCNKKYLNQAKEINCLKISPDNSQVLFSSNYSLTFLDRDLKEVKTMVMPDHIIDFDYSPDGLTVNLLTETNIITLDV